MAPRCIKCRLTDLANRTVELHDEITEIVPYDGELNKEPITLPSKLPLKLMLGTEGIAIGLSAQFCRSVSRSARSADCRSRETIIQVPD